jgi:hypothetical protein
MEKMHKNRPHKNNIRIGQMAEQEVMVINKKVDQDQEIKKKQDA